MSKKKSPKTTKDRRARFVQVWQRAKTLQEAAEELGYKTPQDASFYAYQLRRRGVPLKRFARTHGPTFTKDEVARLAKMC